MLIRTVMPIYHAGQVLEVGVEFEMPPELLGKDGKLPDWAEPVEAAPHPAANPLAGQAPAALGRGKRSDTRSLADFPSTP